MKPSLIMGSKILRLQHLQTPVLSLKHAEFEEISLLMTFTLYSEQDKF